jgi:hypothetical protein
VILPTLPAGEPQLPRQILFQCQVQVLGQFFHRHLAQPYSLAVQHGIRAEKDKTQHQDQHLREHCPRLMMIAVLQMARLSQFIEGFVFDSPAAMPGVVSHLQRIAFERFIKQPPPVALLGLGDLLATDDFLFRPAFVRMNHPYRAPVALSKAQIFNRPELHLPMACLIVKFMLRLLPLAQFARFLKNLHPFLL